MSEVDNTDSIGASESGQSSGPTLGLLLRKAREARGMSVDEVVHALKFSAKQVEAIESDQLDVLPGAVFQRGFIRSYARLLKLDPEPLLGLIDVSAPAPEPEIRAPENMGNAAPRGGLKQVPPLVGVSILLLFAAAVMAGWHYLSGGMPEMKSTIESAKTTIDDARPLPEAARTEVPVVAPEVGSASPAASAPVSTPVAAESTPAQESPALSSDMRRLSFEFSGQSWIEVKDASGLVILTGIYTSGTQSATGRAPFEIVIGNAAVVAVRDNGRVVDMKPHTRAEVARLTLE